MFWKFNLPAIAWAIIIVVLSGYPGDEMPPDPFINFDKLAHSGVYALLAFLLYYGFVKQYTYPYLRYKASLWSFVITVFLGGFMEILQDCIFINRRGDWIDFAADALGALIGVIVAVKIIGNKEDQSA